MAASLGDITQEAKQARHLVEMHLQQKFSLSSAQVDIVYLPDAGQVPAGGMEFVARLRGEIDGLSYNYVVIDGRVYCGMVAGEFVRFLLDYRYFERRDLNVRQVLNLYVLLGPTQNLAYIDEQVIQNSGYSTLKPPALSTSKDGLKLTFYARPMAELNAAPALWTVTVSPDYRLDVHEGERASAR